MAKRVVTGGDGLPEGSITVSKYDARLKRELGTADPEVLGAERLRRSDEGSAVFEWFYAKTGQRSRATPDEIQEGGNDFAYDQTLIVWVDEPVKAPVQPHGGSPTKWDWEGMLIELAYMAAIEQDDIVDRAKLMKRAKAHFGDDPNGGPAESEIRKRVKRFHERLWPPKT